MEKSNVPIGTILSSDNVEVIVKKSTNGCNGCHFYTQCIQPPKIKIMPCFSFERTDGISVFYPDYKP